MFRFRFTSLVLVALVAHAWAVPLPSPLPAGWILFDSNRCTTPVAGVCEQAKNYEIYAQDGSGNVYAVTSDATLDSWWPKLSPDRTKILFHRTDAGLKENDSFRRTSLWWVPVNGGLAPQRLIPAALGIQSVTPHPYGWLALAHAEWSPLQNGIVQLALETGAPSIQIYVSPFNNTTNAVSAPYRVSAQAGGSWRPGQNIDPSYTLDGAAILFIGCPNNTGLSSTCDTGANPQELIVTANVPAASFTSDAALTTTATTYNFDPYYNTDGGQIGWLSQETCNRFGVKHSYWNGASPANVINDGWVNSKPAWISPNTLHFHRWPLVASTVWSVDSSTWVGNLLEPGESLDKLCQTDGISSATASSTVVPDPTGLTTDTIVFNSSRCGSAVCVKPKNWKIYRWTPGGGVNATPWPTGSATSPGDGFDYYNARVSPNRKFILYMRSPHGEKGNAFSQSLWVMNSAGGGATQLIASGDAGNTFSWKTMGPANWSADGTKIVLSAATAAQITAGNSQIYRLNFTSTPTPSVSSLLKLSYGSGAADRPGQNAEPSYSPDGTTVVYTGCALNAGRTACIPLPTRSNFEVIKTSSTSASGESIITNTTDGSAYHSPTYSPAGTTIAAIHSLTCSSTELVKMNTSGTIISTLPGALHFGTQWSYDGTKILFGALPNDFRSTNWKIDANIPTPGNPDDGTNLTAVTASTTPCSSEFPNAGR